MIKSMTAYGRAIHSSSLGRWVVEIHSVNKKSLDFHVHMSRDFLQFDLEIRKWLSSVIQRGHVTVKVNLALGEACSVEHQMRHLYSLKREMEKAALELKFPAEQITFPFLYEQVKLSSLDWAEDEALILEELRQVVNEALVRFLKMKETEGAELKLAFQKHVEVMQKNLSQLEEKTVGIEERYRKKILDKLGLFKEVLDEDRERVLREVFLYAEKIDIEEEITRLKSHMGQFLALLESSERSVGRTMDFLIQEMGREINTISSKSDDLDLSLFALKMKNELEKIREQAQNVE